MEVVTIYFILLLRTIACFFLQNPYLSFFHKSFGLVQSFLGIWHGRSRCSAVAMHLYPRKCCWTFLQVSRTQRAVKTTVAIPLVLSPSCSFLSPPLYHVSTKRDLNITCVTVPNIPPSFSTTVVTYQPRPLFDFRSFFSKIIYFGSERGSPPSKSNLGAGLAPWYVHIHSTRSTRLCCAVLIWVLDYFITSARVLAMTCNFTVPRGYKPLPRLHFLAHGNGSTHVAVM